MELKLANCVQSVIKIIKERKNPYYLRPDLVGDYSWINDKNVLVHDYWDPNIYLEGFEHQFLIDANIGCSL